MKFRRWTADEKQVITDMYWDATREEILARLPLRKWSAVVDKACEMGVKRDHGLANSRAVDPNRERIKKDLERRVLEFIITHTQNYGVAPTKTQISDGTGMNPSTARLALRRLEAKGFIEPGWSGRQVPILLNPAFRRKLVERQVSQVRAAMRAA